MFQNVETNFFFWNCGIFFDWNTFVNVDNGIQKGKHWLIEYFNFDTLFLKGENLGRLKMNNFSFFVFILELIFVDLVLIICRLI